MLRWLIVMVMACCVLTVRADFDEALAQYQKGDYAPAYTEFKRLAEFGQHPAQFNLGVMYYRGEAVPRDVSTGYGWMALAAQGGQKEWATLRDKVFNSLNAQQQAQATARRDELFKLYSDTALSEQLAPVLVQDFNDEELLKPVKRITPEFPEKMAGKTGWVDLVFSVAKDGSTRNHGVVSASDPKFIPSAIKAVRQWRFQPVIIDGKPVEIYGQNLRIKYVYYRDTQFRENKVKEYSQELREKAQTGTALDQYRYAYSLELLPSYTHVKLDYRDSGEWYLRSASNGFPPAQFELGKKLLYGQGCRADSAKSLIWLQKAAEQGLPDARYLLAIEMLSGMRVARNVPAALTWLEKAADSGDGKAQLKLAWVLATIPDQALRNGSRAQNYLSHFKEDYFDDVTVFETRAAVFAELGDFNNAVKWQKQAYEEAENYGLPLEAPTARLAAYQQNRAWTEEL